MADIAQVTELLKNYPRLTKALGWSSVVSVALGTVTGLLGKASELKRILFELVGPQNLVSIHVGMTFFVGGLFIVGYLSLALWIYKRYVSTLEQRRRYLYSSFLAICGLLLAAASIFAAIPSVPDVRELLRKESVTLEKELLELGVEGGGLRYNRLDHSVQPQTWLTAQSLTAVLSGRKDPLSDVDAKHIREHLDFIDRVRLQSDEGWGYMEQIDWGVTEIAGWVALAYVASAQPGIVDVVWGRDSTVAYSRLTRDLRLLQQRQMKDGSWAPVKQTDNAKFARTYSTVMALWALVEASKHPEIRKRTGITFDDSIKGGIQWLLANYDKGLGGWSPNPGRARQTDNFSGLTGHVLYVLSRAMPDFEVMLKMDQSYNDAQHAYLTTMVEGSTFSPSLISRPAGNNDRTHDSDRYLTGSKFMIESSTFLWFPWALSLCAELKQREPTAEPDRGYAKRGCAALAGRVNDLIKFARNDPFAYVMAESLLAIRLHLAGTGGVRNKR